jgi:hypothetical protein
VKKRTYFQRLQPRTAQKHSSLRSPAAVETAPTREVVVDTVWLLMDPIALQRLTRERGWTPEQYQEWFTVGVARQLLLDSDSGST